MMLLCPRHGRSSGMSVCSHIQQHVLQGQRVAEFHVLVYEYLGTAADGCVFCRECGQEHGILGHVVTPLPDNYPAYFPRTSGVCGRCFREATGTDIDWSVRVNAEPVGPAVPAAHRTLSDGRHSRPYE